MANIRTGERPSPRSEWAGGCCWYGMLGESVVGRSGLTSSGVVVLFHRVAAGSDEL